MHHAKCLMPLTPPNIAWLAWEQWVNVTYIGMFNDISLFDLISMDENKLNLSNKDKQSREQKDITSVITTRKTVTCSIDSFQTSALQNKPHQQWKHQFVIITCQWRLYNLWFWKYRKTRKIYFDAPESTWMDAFAMAWCDVGLWPPDSTCIITRGYWSSPVSFIKIAHDMVFTRFDLMDCCDLHLWPLTSRI